MRSFGSTLCLLTGMAVALTAMGVCAQTAALTNPVDGAELVAVPAGTFSMGSAKGQGDERPVHAVGVSAFALYKYEVTNEQYAAFCKSTGHAPSPFAGDGRFGGARQPVVGITWNDAAAYAKWAKARLPTEAEWEYAARGTDERRYPWGNQPPTDARANFDQPTSNGSTKPVGSTPTGAGPFGAQDQAGNAWEWVADWYAYDYYAHSPKENPTGPTEGKRRVLRGGSWGYPSELRASYRFYEKPEFSTNYVGFRCATAAP